MYIYLVCIGKLIVRMRIIVTPINQDWDGRPGIENGAGGLGLRLGQEAWD